MEITRCPFPPLPTLQILLVATILLFSQGYRADGVSGLAITHHPTSQVIKLGETATFSCSATAIGRGGSFDLVILPPFRSTAMYIKRYGPQPDWMNVDIILHHDEATDTLTYNATVSIIGNEAVNETTIRCRIFVVMDDALFSNTANLSIIGPPVTPTHLSLPLSSEDMELGQFIVIWDTPYSHTGHPVTSYTVTLTSVNTSHIIISNVSSFPDSGPVQQMLSFPPRTTSCDILNISIIATNDIGSSQPAYTSLFVPTTVGSVTADIVEQYNSQDGVIVVIEIKFSIFCWFERVEYTVVLEEVGGGGKGEIILKEGSKVNPQEPVIETLSSDVVANTNYSVVVKARTSLWNYTTSPVYFTPEEKVTEYSQPSSETSTSIPSLEGVGSNGEDSESSVSPVILGGVGGAIGVLIILIIIVAIIIWSLHARNKRPRMPITIEDMKISRVPHDLTPNPIYGGPLYETVGDPVPPDTLSFKPEIYPLPPSSFMRESVYSESPTLSKHRQINLSEDGEEAYIQMNTSRSK